MNRVNLEATLAERAGVPRATVSKILSGFEETVANQLANGDDVRLLGFGTFSVRESSARVGKNPRTGEEIQIPARRKAVFRPGRELSARVNA